MLKIIRASTGIGKTHIAIDEAVDRAALGLRTAIIQPTHQLLTETQEALRQKGIEPRYERSVLSILDDNDKPICRHHDTGVALARNGMFARPELCKGLSGAGACEHIETCRAYNYKPERSDVTIAPHALLPKALVHAGKAGLLVIDEAIETIETITIDENDIDNAVKYTGYFHSGSIYKIVLRAIAEGTPTGNDLRAMLSLESLANNKYNNSIFRSPNNTLSSFLRQRAMPLSDDWRKNLLAALRTIRVVQMTKAAIVETRDGGDVELAGRLGRAAETINALAGALIDEPRSLARVDEGKLYVTRVHNVVRQALSRPGDTWLLDATCDEAALRAIIGDRTDVEFIDVRASDSAQVTRKLIYSPRLVRKHCIRHGRPLWADGLGGVLRRIVDEAIAAGATALVIITLKVVADVLRDAWERPQPGGEPERLLDRWRGRQLCISHYEQIRGLNGMQDADALATVGDPWANLIAIRQEAEALGIDFDAYYEKKTTAAIDQAQGRIRVSRRDAPALLIHAGAVPPESWRGKDVEVLEMATGRPRSVPASVRGDVLKSWRKELGLTQQEASEMLGISTKTLKRAEKGTKPVTEKKRPNGRVAITGSVPFQPSRTGSVNPAYRLPASLTAPGMLGRAAEALRPQFDALDRERVSGAVPVMALAYQAA